MRIFVWLCFALLATGAGAAGLQNERNPVRTHPHGVAQLGRVQHIIVKLRGSPAASVARVAAVVAAPAERAAEQQRINALLARTGFALQSSHRIMSLLHVLHVEPGAGSASLAQTLARLRADPDVEYAEGDQRRYIHTVPDDPLYSPGVPDQDGSGVMAVQWYEQPPVAGGSSATPSAVDAADAWSVTTGSNGLVIADIDTGVRFDHPDLLGAGTNGSAVTGRLLSGYCFISDSFVANGVACPGPDASDPGDWITSSDVTNSPQGECTNATASNSSWHGTRTAGILGALTNNATGMAGMTWNAWILPLRALGKCGGTDSDIQMAMLWAAGVAVDGYPPNPYPARIINMSLGGTGSCPSSYLTVMSQLNALGVLVVASAGNEGGPVDAPGNCPGVAAIGGLRQEGTKVGFSNLGPQVAVSAPAGNCVNITVSSPCLYSIVSLTNDGTQGPTSNDYTTHLVNDPSLGTSFSAPIVSGIAALMISANANLKGTQLIQLLEQTATQFPQTSTSTNPVPKMCYDPASGDDTQDVECICTNAPAALTCGAGMANASAAVNAAAAPIPAINVPSSFAAGATVTLDASGSAAACSQSINSSSYQWSSNSGTDPVSSASGSSTTIKAPPSGSVVVTLTLTDAASHSSTATVTVYPTDATTVAPASAGGTCLPPLTVVSVSPAGPAAQVGGTTVNFTASLGDTSDNGVTWQVNGITGGDATYGTISSSGVYTSPATLPGSSSNVEVSAVSMADSTKVGWTQVTLYAPAMVSILPNTANVLVGGTQVFTATVTGGNNNPSITWSVNGVVGGNAQTTGSISTTGAYFAPATVPSPNTVTVSASSGTNSAAAQVTISAAGSSSSSSSSASATSSSSSSSSGGKSGGGGVDGITILVSAGLAAAAARRRSRSTARSDCARRV
jgi:serine protease